MKKIFALTALALTFTFGAAAPADAGGSETVYTNASSWWQPSPWRSARPGRPDYRGPGRYNPPPSQPSWPSEPTRPSYPDRDWRGGGGGHHWGAQVTCRAYDNGWEEHWGGHGSCGECLSKHGSCTERCTADSFSCTATGSRDGYTESFEAYSDRSEYEARNQALDRCYYSGSRGCSILRCDKNSRTVSSRSCSR